MKKIVCLVLILFICIGTVLALTEDDIKTMDTDELKTLYTLIYNELNLREKNIEYDIKYDDKDIIENGIYECDKDIPEGLYTIKVIKALESCEIGVLDTESNNIIFHEYVKKDGYDFTFSFKKNQKLGIQNAGIATLKKVSDKNWMQNTENSEKR